MNVIAEQPLDQIDVGNLDLWEDGPPHELFTRLRGEAPVHWSPLAEYPHEGGFWSLTRAEDIRAVSLDWQTYSSYVGGIMVLDDFGIPLEAQQQQMISMDPPRHDRIKALFQRGFTPKRIAEHTERIRGIVNTKLDLVCERGECDLVNDVAGPVVTRVIGSLIGSDPADDLRHMEETNMVLGFGDEDLRPTEEAIVEMMTRNWNETMEIVAERRKNPGMDDLIDVLVHGEVDGEGLSDDEIFMGLGLLGAAGNDSTRSVFTSGMLGLFENPDQLRLLLDDPGVIPDAVEELLRMYPAFANFRRTATRDVELHGQQIAKGDKVLLWYVVLQPRRVGLRDRSGPRHHPQARPPGIRRRRPALLPRRSPCPARDPDVALRDTAPSARHRARRRAHEGPLDVPEPAQDPAGEVHSAGARERLAPP